MVKLELSVRKVTVLITRHGTDCVTVQLADAPTPFPELDAREPGLYPPNGRFEVRAGYGYEWARKTFGPKVTIEIIHEATGKVDVHEGSPANA